MKHKELRNNKVLSVFFLFAILVVFCACKTNKKVPADVDKPIQLSSEIIELRNEIAKANYIGTEQTSRKPGMDPNFAERLKLMRIATDDELLTLSGDTSSVVALTAFEGLYKRGNKVVPDIFNGFMERSDIINYIKGDLFQTMPMLEYAYVNVLHYKIPNEVFPDEVEGGEPKYALSDSDQKKAILKIAELRAEKVNPQR